MTRAPQRLDRRGLDVFTVVFWTLLVSLAWGLPVAAVYWATQIR